jgi:hypothetical protein
MLEADCFRVGQVLLLHHVQGSRATAMKYTPCVLFFCAFAIALLVTTPLATARDFLGPTADLPPPKSNIGVASAIGTTLLTYDNNGRDVSLNIATWEIDNLVVSQAIQRLQGRYQIAAAHLDNNWISNRGMFWRRDPTGTNTDPNGGFAYYLLIHQSWISNKMQFDCKQPGLAFAWSDSIFLRWGIACAHYEIELVDAKTGKTLRVGEAELPDDKATRNNEAFLQIDKAYWPDRSGHWTTEQLNYLQERYGQLVSLTFAKALSDMGL